MWQTQRPSRATKTDFSNENVLKQGFQPQHYWHLGPEVVRCEFCPVHYGMFISTHGCWWHAISYKGPKRSSDAANCPLWGKMLPAETTALGIQIYMLIPCIIATSGKWILSIVSILKKILTDSFFKKCLFIWLCWVLDVACGIFSYSMWSLCYSMWDLVPWPRIEPRPPALERAVLATGPPGNPWLIPSFSKYYTVDMSLLGRGNNIFQGPGSGQGLGIRGKFKVLDQLVFLEFILKRSVLLI